MSTELFNQKKGAGGGAGQGLQSVAIVFNQAASGGKVTNDLPAIAGQFDTLAALPLGGEHLAAAWRDDVQPVGPLLAACQLAAVERQGAADLQLGERQARKLLARMAGDGRIFLPVEVANIVEDASQAAAAALAAWRCGVPQDGAERGAAGVAWRAVVGVCSEDGLGDSVEPLHTLTDESIFSRVLPRESKIEQWQRWFAEASRPAYAGRLPGRLERLKAAGGRGGRKAAIDKVGHALGLILGGMDLDEAATLAGFKPAAARGAAGGGKRAGDFLIRSCKRLGIVGDAFAISRR